MKVFVRADGLKPDHFAKANLVDTEDGNVIGADVNLRDNEERQFDVPDGAHLVIEQMEDVEVDDFRNKMRRG